MIFNALHNYNKISRRSILVALPVLCTFFVYSQDEKSQADTIIADSSINKYDEEGREEDSTAKYFLKTSVYEENPDSFRLRKIPDSIIRTLQDNDAFWYANAEKQKEKEKEVSKEVSQKEPFLIWLARQQWFKALVWIIIIGGFTAVVVWYLAVSNVSIFRKVSKTIGDADVNEETDNIFGINYPSEIQKAIETENYRLAIRLLFLRLLKTLSEKNVIQYKQDRTNFDYLLQLHNTSYYKDVFRLTRNYEYSWYGKFDVTVQAFTIIKNDFDKFDQKINY